MVNGPSSYSLPNRLPWMCLQIHIHDKLLSMARPSIGMLGMFALGMKVNLNLNYYSLMPSLPAWENVGILVCFLSSAHKSALLKCEK